MRSAQCRRVLHWAFFIDPAQFPHKAIRDTYSTRVDGGIQAALRALPGPGGCRGWPGSLWRRFAADPAAGQSTV